MGEISPLEPRVNDPELEANLIRLLSITGPLGTIRVADIVLPTVSLGSVVTETVTVLQPSFRSTDVFSADIQVGAPANTVHADTGPQPDGVYNFQLFIAPHLTDSVVWHIEHRNATNTATLMIWKVIVIAGQSPALQKDLGYELATNERLRILNSSVITAGVFTSATIFARRRP